MDRFDGLSLDKFMIAMSSSGSKNVDGDCKLAVEALQDSNLSSKVCQNLSITRSHCFHFPNSNISVIPYTHVPTGKTFSLNASIVLFPDPVETTASKPHRMNSQSVRISGSFLFLIK